MPLHLLGKKSWNVYNPQNIARVRQDEAEAKTKDEKVEREARDDETATRLRALRGEEALRSLPSSATDVSRSHSDLPSREISRKRRKLAGEDDTDRDIRLAQADVQAKSSKQDEVNLFDSKGHISLVPEHRPKLSEQARLQKDEESQGMRFKDATGYKSDGKPWYNDRSTLRESGYQESKDVWGNEDPRRRQREQQRMASNDPLSAMKRGVKQLRENEKQRREWMEQREKDLYEVERMARRQKRRRQHDSDEDSLEGFDLDAPVEGDSEKCAASSDRGSKSHRHRHRHGHKHRHRSRSPGRAHHRHRHRDRDRSDDP